MKYELSEQVILNIKAFLNRVDLKGSEAIAIVEILNCLANPIKEVKEEK